MHLLNFYINTNLEEITVQQIADLADVNRSTFYTHYYDKYDLLEKLEDQQLGGNKRLHS